MAEEVTLHPQSGVMSYKCWFSSHFLLFIEWSLQPIKWLEWAFLPEPKIETPSQVQSELCLLGDSRHCQVGNQY